MTGKAFCFDMALEVSFFHSASPKQPASDLDVLVTGVNGLITMNEYISQFSNDFRFVSDVRPCA